MKVLHSFLYFAGLDNAKQSIKSFLLIENTTGGYIGGGCIWLLQPYGLWSSRLLCPWDSPGKNTGVGCHFLLQRIFPTQGLNPGLLHCRQILYCWATTETLLNHQGSPLEVKPIAIIYVLRGVKLYAKNSAKHFRDLTL